MNIDELIEELEQVREEHGNLEVKHYPLYSMDSQVEKTELLNGKEICGIWL